MDQLHSFTSILETRKQKRQSAKAVFIYLSRQYGRRDRVILFQQLAYKKKIILKAVCYRIPECFRKRLD